MDPRISITAYLLFQLLLILLSRRAFKKRFQRGFSWFLLPFLLCALFPIGGAFLPDSGFKFILQKYGNLSLGWTLYYAFFLVLLLALGAFLGWVGVKKIREQIFRQSFLVSLLCASTLLLYGVIHARQPVLVNLDLEIPKEVQGEDGDLTIALLADLHLSVNSSPKHIQEVVDLTNAQNPDLIVVAGDIFTSSYKALSHPSKYASILRGLKARYGVVAIYGNHDVEEVLFGGFAISPVSEAFRSPQMEDFMRECGFTLLEDESLVLEGTNIQLVGRVDGKKAGDGSRNRLSPQDLLKGLDITAPILVLEHEPDEYQDLAEAGADLVLSGHTHNGQIFPGNLIIRLFHENPYGYRCLYDIHTVVTAGVGYYGPPMRVGTNSEVVLIRLRFA